MVGSITTASKTIDSLKSEKKDLEAMLEASNKRIKELSVKVEGSFGQVHRLEVIKENLDSIVIRQSEDLDRVEADLARTIQINNSLIRVIELISSRIPVYGSIPPILPGPFGPIPSPYPQGPSEPPEPPMMPKPGPVLGGEGRY